MASDDKPDDQKKKGFAALSTLVSNVEHTVSQAQKSAEVKPAVKAATTAPNPTQPAKAQDPPPTRSSLQPVLWLVGLTLAAFGGMYAYYNTNSDDYDGYSSQRSSYSVAETQSPTPAWETPATEQPVVVRPLEEKPPVGTDRFLTENQIRYCLAEEMRLEAAQPILDPFNELQVSEFNGYVGDYNSRCSSFQYYEISFEAAQRDVFAFGEEIRAEGISRFSLPEQNDQTTSDQITADNLGWNGPETDLTLEESSGLDAAELSEFDRFLEEADSTLKTFESQLAEDQALVLSESSEAPDIRLQNRAASAASPQSSGASESEVRTAFPVSPPRLTFPRRAAERGISGTCEVYFDLDARGKPMNVVAVCSSRLFQAEAERAIAQTEFVPKRVDGRPVEQRDMVYPLEFVLD